MNQHPTPEDVLHHPERIHGYSYGTSSATPSPLTLDDLTKLKAAAGLTDADEATLRAVGEVLAPRAADMVAAWRNQVAQHPFLATTCVTGIPCQQFARPLAVSAAVRP